MAIAKLNEAMLFQMGFDRVAIDALRHLINQVGDVVGAPTLPQVAQQVVTVVEQVDLVDQSPYHQPPQDPLEGFTQSPVFDMAIQIEFVETQVRSLAEQVVAVSRRLRDIEQGASL